MSDSAKLQLLLDREQIREAVYAYPVSIDTRDWKRFRSIFSDEVEVLLKMADNPRQPQRIDADRFTKAVQKGIEAFAATQHLLNDYRIEVNGDEAKCLLYMYARHIASKNKPGRPPWDIGGYYEFHLRRTGNGWKVPKYALILTWETDRPSDQRIDL
ncbi:MAG TPA: nuclear transport factor 2 family protein [Candidatus Binataceae bacterium]|nr:nuclear transport factor 2 family protein [Candidatus Binataceae bacterium]